MNISMTDENGGLPAAQHLWADTRSGTMIKYHLYYPRPFWREAGLSGKTLTGAGA
jgi:monoamine oxidase